MRSIQLHRKWISLLAIVLASLAPTYLLSSRGMANEGRVIELTAQRYHFTPAEVQVKQGEQVVLEITSVDFVHGFKVPELNLRVNLAPGKVTSVPLTFDKAGAYDFLCDNFCGSGHEEMNGRIVVTR